jgi:hypothetical protein
MAASLGRKAGGATVSRWMIPTMGSIARWRLHGSPRAHLRAGKSGSRAFARARYRAKPRSATRSDFVAQQGCRASSAHRHWSSQRSW